VKLFDLDWGALLRSLPAWERLDVKARRRLLDTLKPSGAVPATHLGEELDALRLAGLVELSGTRAAVPEPMRPLVLALRGMDRHHVLFREPTLKGLTRYLAEHFTAQELQALQTGSHGSYSSYSRWVDRHQVAQEVASVDWIGAFLALESTTEARAWEDAHRGREDHPLLDDPGMPGIFETTKRLLETLLPHPEGLPLRELPTAVGGVPGPILGAALHAALHYLLGYAVLDPATLDPRVGLWPPAAARLGQPPPPPPQPVEPVESFHAALLMEDMTAVLVAASGEPLRLRGNDYEIFARQQQAIAERLVVVPPWAEKSLGLRVENRISVAAFLLRVLELAQPLGEEGTDLRLEPTRQGASWLALSDRDRLASLLDPLRASEERNPTGRYYPGVKLRFFPQQISLSLPDDRFDTRIALADAFLTEDAASFLPLDDFLEFHSRTRNPFLEERQGGRLAPRVTYGGPLARREELERLWADLLRSFFALRLFLLGGARVGRAADGRLCFAITDVGWYLFEGAEDFHYGHDVEAEVVVQPNFEIVFLTPAPTVEAQLARFAERKGAGPGVMFRLTRTSVLAAAEAGMTPDQVLGVLRQASSRELPPNVERQVRDWFGTVRRIALRHTVLIRCPDEETALRVRAAAGDTVRPLTDTILELTNSAAPAKRALLRKLRKEGVFVEG
jgi:hypothetical protein